MNHSPGHEPDGRGGTPWVYVTDATAEGAVIAAELRHEGYAVAEISILMLVARVATQRPRALVVDADTDGAFEAVARVRELEGTDDIDVIFVGNSDGVLSSQEEALMHDGSGFFPRPVDKAGLTKKIAALVGTPHSNRASWIPKEAPSRPNLLQEAMVDSSQLRQASVVRGSASIPPFSPLGVAGVSHSSLPPASMRSVELHSSRPPVSVSPMSTFPSDARDLAMGALVGAKGAFPGSPLSPELSLLLAEAEGRVPAQRPPESIPSPEEEIEAVLPASLLEALDEPLGGEEEAEAGADDALVRNTLGPTARATTGVETGAGRGTQASEVPATPPPPKTHGGSTSPTTGATHGGSTTGGRPKTTNATRSSAGVTPNAGSFVERAAVARPPAPPTPAVIPTSTRPPKAPSAPKAFAPTVVARGDAAKVLAEAVSRRLSGALAFDSPAGVRRIVMREGDLITAASASAEETLLAFLAQRGDLPRELAARISVKIPAFGRHAAAALVAHGYLRQDHMWPVLRAHAESVIARTFTDATGSVVVEDDPPGRLKSEPGVFGGSTGAEVLIDLLRREVPDDVALSRLRASSRIDIGPNSALMAECGLPQEMRRAIEGAASRTVFELTNPPSEVPPAVLLALSWLGVVAVTASLPARADSERPKDDDRASEAALLALDAEAVRATVRARMQLVEEGDYFAVLGVPRSATGYEIRRAFLDLRRTFEPSKLLTPDTAALLDDVRSIALVLDEAYDILRDPARRERYRRAISGDRDAARDADPPPGAPPPARPLR